MPFFGKLFRVARPLSVNRQEGLSRNVIMEKIKQRVNDYSQPQLAVFPEGTNSNRKVISFKLVCY